MNEFLRKNKELFSSKREFLTKLREVRQKFMNNLSKDDEDDDDDNVDQEMNDEMNINDELNGQDLNGHSIKNNGGNSLDGQNNNSDNDNDDDNDNQLAETIQQKTKSKRSTLSTS
jgi:hypothetical protein